MIKRIGTKLFSVPALIIALFVFSTSLAGAQWMEEILIVPPDIRVEPPSLFSQQKPDLVVVLPLDIQNLGVANLDWNIVEAQSPACTPHDIPWASVSPDTGTTAAAGTAQIDVTLDSTGLAVGTYNGALCINSNDPDTPVIVVPLEIEVYTYVEIASSPQEFNISVIEGNSDQDLLTIDSLGDGSLEWVIFTSTGGIDALGEWTVYYDWGCTGFPGSATIIFNPDFSFTDSQGGSGTWTQSANFIVWTYSIGTQYTGYIAGNHMAGTMQSFNGSPGCWETVRSSGPVALHSGKFSASGEESSLSHSKHTGSTVKYDTEESLSWLDIFPSMGWLPPGFYQRVIVGANSSGLSAEVNFGLYFGLIRLYSRDPDEALIAIPVVLEVVEKPKIYLPMVLRP